MRNLITFLRPSFSALSAVMRSGFSLIELLVVVAIIGILAAIGSIGYSRYIESARNAAIIAIAKQISDALQACDTNNTCKDYVPTGGNPKNVYDVLLGDGSGTNGLIASLGSKNPWDNTPINGMSVNGNSDSPPFSSPNSLSPFIGNVDAAGNSGISGMLMQFGGYTFCGGLGHIFINTNYASASSQSTEVKLPPNGIQIGACTVNGIKTLPIYGPYPGQGLGDANSPAPFSLINFTDL